MADRIGRQTPTVSFILPYTVTKGGEAIELYNKSSKTAMEWEELMMFDIMAVNDDGLWTHSKFGYSVPRRNGKNELLTMREFWGLKNNEKILHTAHRTTTSSSAAKRLATLLTEAGYEEVQRPKKDEKYDKHFTYSKQFGLERIVLLCEGGGSCDFRTRTSKGGLGEGFDLLIIDEAQEYQDDQETSLKYVVSDSMNPQTILCGTPPTAVSTGTVFTKLRTNILDGGTEDTGWAEWSVPKMSDCHDIDLWYETNPSMGLVLTERKVKAEIGTDEVDFNIQRLGLWMQYNQKSAITENDWNDLMISETLEPSGKLFVGIKYGHSNENVSVSIAVRHKEKIFVEAIDCRSIKSGNDWILRFLSRADVQTVVIDGANGQSILADEMKKEGLGQAKLPKVDEVIEAYSVFTQGIYSETLCHKNQPSLTNAITNCEKRLIGSKGGFGYRTNKEGVESALIDSTVLAYWACSKAPRVRKKQKVSY